MANSQNHWIKENLRLIIWVLVLAVVLIGGFFTQASWMPHAQRLVDVIQGKSASAAEDPHDHAADAGAASGAGPDSVKLTPSAWKNIGMETGTVKPANFVKEVSVPAIVADRVGRSHNEITAPMTGIVSQVFPLEREVVEPGTPLFELRLTHEDVVSAQSDLLNALKSLDLINKELVRLQNIGSGIIPGKRIVEQKYQQEKASSSLAAMRQSLLLHGLSEQQIEDIERTRTVLRDVTVVAPPFSIDEANVRQEYHVQVIEVNRGQSVIAGQTLGVLGDHGLLYVEGQAFEDDAQRLLEASQSGNKVKVVPMSGKSSSNEALHLDVQSVAAEIDERSRALKFYLLLPNVKNERPASSPATVSGKQFVAWKYRPGQRMEARIPMSKELKNKIVLPPEAVVIEGPNAFIFEQNGDNFDRIDVHVLYRDKNSVVLENDGQLIGSTIAMTGAFDLHLALKNQSGGAIDPHAGHTH